MDQLHFVSIDQLLSEDSVPLAESSHLFPDRPSVPTMRRWASSGVGGVKLQTFRSGGTRHTTIPASQRFLAAQNGDVLAPSRAEAADKQLEELGVK